MLMLMFRNSLLSSIVITIIISSLQSTDCRYHYHKPATCRKDHNHQDTINYISLPPLSAPSRSPCLPSFHLSPLPSPSPSPYYERTLANSTLEDSSPPLPSSIIPTLPPSYLFSPSPSPSPSLPPLLAPSYSNYNSSNSNTSCDSNPPLSSPSPLPSTSLIISPLHSPSNSPLSSPALSSLPSPSYDNSTSKNPNNSSTPIVLYPPIPSPSCENSTSNNTTIIESPNNPSTPIMFHPPPPSPSLPSPSYYNSSSNNSTFTSPSPSPAISNDNSNPPSPSPSPSPSSNNVTSKNPNISPVPMIFNPPLPSPSLPSPISNDSATPNPSNGSLITPTIFNIKSFGAIGNRSCDDTKAMRSAWKSACVAENAILLIPADGVFMVTSTIFTGPCRSGFVLQIDGVLMPPDGPDCWPETDSRKQWLVFYRANNMTLRGEGTIEGNGENWWNLPCKPHRGPNGSTLPGPCDSPVLIRFFMSNNVTVEGLRIVNSPQFHIKFDVCNGVLISKMWINSPSFSPNTDGIHIENTKSVQIYNSRINNGDDCISIGAGCADVHIENVTCGLGHGISIGSLGAQNSLACVSNITVRNTRIHDSDNGVRIKTWQGGTGSVSGIIFDTIVMENVRNCINIDQYYCTNKQCKNQTLAIYVSDVSYSNIKGTYNIKSPPVHFACSDSMPCSNITLSEVELLPYEGETIMGPFCWNAYGNLATLTIPPIYCLQEGRPQSLQENLNTGC